MSSAGVIAHSIFGGGVWFAGPVAVNGALGGSEHYYKRTEDVTDWSGAPIALPLGKLSLTRITTAKNGVWMIFNTADSIVSFDAGDTWQECNTALPEEDVFWNGRKFVCGGLMSSDGLVWAAIPNLAADTRRFTSARQQDGLIVCAFVPGTGTYFEYTLDDGATWTNVAQGGSFADEDVYSLTTSSRTGRINYSMNNVSPATGITGFYTDDLFVNRLRDGGSYPGRYDSMYGCSRLVQVEDTNRIIVSVDGGWSWSDSETGLLFGVGNHAIDFGNNVWAMYDITALGSPRTCTIRYSTDGALTWNTGDTVYGSLTSVAYVGRDGNCALYRPPTYAAASNYELWQGTPDAVSTLGERTWHSFPCFSPDGEYIIDQDSGDNVILYKKNANGLGYAEVEGAFSPVKGPATAGTNWAVSADNQYFVGLLDAGNGWWAFRRVGNVYTELTPPDPTKQFNSFVFLPGTNTLAGARSTTGVVDVYTFSGDTISGPYTSASTGHAIRSLTAAHNNAWVVGSTVFDDIRILDVSDPVSGVTIIGNSLLTASNGGNCGVYFTSDDTGIITVSASGVNPGNIHYHSWDGSSTIGAATLLGTTPYRTQDSALTQDGQWLFVIGDLSSPYAVIKQLATDGTSILSSYNPTTSPGSSQGNYVTWMGV